MLPYTGDYTEHFDSEKPSLTFYSFTPRSLMRGGCLADRGPQEHWFSGRAC